MGQSPPAAFGEELDSLPYPVVEIDVQQVLCLLQSYGIDSQSEPSSWTIEQCLRKIRVVGSNKRALDLLSRLPSFSVNSYFSEYGRQVVPTLAKWFHHLLNSTPLTQCEIPVSIGERRTRVFLNCEPHPTKVFHYYLFFRISEPAEGGETVQKDPNRRPFPTCVESFVERLDLEARAPLSSIIGFGEMLLDPIQSSAQRVQCAKTIIRNGRQLLLQLSGLQDLYRIETATLKLERKNFSPFQEIASTISLFQYSLEDKGLNFDIEYEGLIPKYLYTDPVRFRLILANLLDNAIKYTDEGAIKLKVRRMPGAKQNRGGLLAIFVKDTGRGLSLEQQEALIKSMNTPIGEVDKSTSIGLNVSKQLAIALGGDVVLLDSDPQRGSTFIMTIDPAPNDETPMVSEPSKEIENFDPIGRRKRETPELKGLSVLIVEDCEDNQILLKHFLEYAGTKVELAGSGEEGVQKALNGRYDVVLMDIQMPGLDGYQATKKLRQNGFKQPIVALTASTGREFEEKCLQAGCNSYLSKPVRRSLLLHRVAQFAQ